VGPSEDAKEVGQTKREIAERYGIRERWWTKLVERSAAIPKLHAHITPAIQDGIISAMDRWEYVLRPSLKTLKLTSSSFGF